MAVYGWLERAAGRPGWWRGPDGVRTGWRAGAFVLLLAGGVLAEAGVIVGLHLPHPAPGGLVTPGFMAFNEALLLLPAWLASLVMARLEGRGVIAACGLADARRHGRCAIGFMAGAALLGALVLVLSLSGHAGLAKGGLGMRGIAAYVVIWAAASLLIGIAEEFTFRGYLFQSLSRGGFGLALAVTSLAFGLVHYSNGGEGLIGVSNAVLAGAIFALLIWRTGSLWASIGLHGGWDYGENFLFGAHDSGQGCAFTLLQLSPAGVPWLSGGATGPEGSLLATGILTAAGLAILLWRRKPPTNP